MAETHLFDSPGTTYDDDAEEVVIHHNVPQLFSGQKHIHHGRVVICKKTADEIKLEPLQPHKVNEYFGHEGRYVFARTADKDDKGRAIFREAGR